jgi:hypothetical protein
VISIEKYNPEEWALVSENIHRGVFHREKPAAWDRISYVLVAYENSIPLGYITIQEMNSDTAYLQFGGAFPRLRHSHRVWLLFEMGLQPLLSQYTKIFFLVENTNKPMLKLAHKSGFLITGVRVHQGNILVEHSLDRKEA